MDVSIPYVDTAIAASTAAKVISEAIRPVRCLDFVVSVSTCVGSLYGSMHRLPARWIGRRTPASSIMHD